MISFSTTEWWILAGGAACLVAVIASAFGGDSLRSMLVLRAAADVDRVIETAKNTGPEIDRYLAAVKEAPGANWCAAGLAAWLRDVYDERGEPVPFQLVSGAKLQGQILTRYPGARWVPAALIDRLTVPLGSILVWDRSNPPHSGYEGHIGVLERWQDADTMETIEANSGPRGDRVARMRRPRNDPRLLGAAVL